MEKKRKETLIRQADKIGQKHLLLDETGNPKPKSNPPNHVYFFNAWLPVCRAREVKDVWVNPGLGIIKQK